MTEHPKHGSPGTANYIDARTTWFDQAVQGAEQSGLSQIVIIAAGFDSRAYRLHEAGLQVWRLLWVAKTLPLHHMVLTQRHYCSQNSVIGSQLHCPYMENVLTSSVVTNRHVVHLVALCVRHDMQGDVVIWFCISSHV